jgi:putative ABC transport system permease protein
MNRILFLEAITIGGKPIVITVPFASIFVIFAANESDISLAEFLENLPILPLSLFAIMILGFVALAYYIGGRKISKLDLIGTLKDDTLG